MITARNPVHSALFLVLAFVQSAALWLLIEAEFLAIVLVLVYVGAVMVLFLFVVMMLDINVEELRKGFTRYATAGCGSGVDRGRRDRPRRLVPELRARVPDRAGAVARGLQQHEGARRGALHGARLRVRDRRGDPAARDRGRDHAHDAAAPGPRCRTSPAGSRAARGPSAARQSGAGAQTDDDHRYRITCVLAAVLSA